MAEELFTELLKNFGKNLKKAKEEGKITGGYRFEKDGKLKVGGGYYDDDKMFEVSIDKDNANVLFKKRFADGGSTNGSGDKAFTGKVKELMDDGYEFGEAVKEAMKQGYKDGGITTAKRGLVDGPGSYAGLTIKQALSQIFKTQTTFKNREELLGKLKTLGLKDTNIKTLTPVRYPILSTVIYTDFASTRVTEKMLEEYLGKEKLDKLRKEGEPERKIRNRVYGNTRYKKLNKDQLEERRIKNKANLKNNPDLVNRDRIASAERSQARRRGEAKFYRVQKANSLVWNDFIRSAQSDDGLLKFSGNKPEPGKRYNKVETEKFVFVDKNNNKIRYNSLMSDIKKAGLNAEKLFLPYQQKEYLAAEKVTQELNKALGYTKRGNTKSVWNVQHIEGIGKSLDNVHLTFGTENIAEGGARRTFDAAFKNATTLNDVGKIGDANYKPGKKTAVKNYYKSLGPNIVAKIGKKAIGKAPALTELLSRVKDAKGNIITSPNINRVMANLNQSDKANLNRLVEKQIATVKRYASTNGIQLNSFAGVVDLSQSGLTMPPAVKNALNTIIKYGGKTLRGVGKGAIVLDPIFAAYDFSTAIDQGAGGKNSSKYMVKRFGESLLNLPDLVASGGKFVKDKLQGEDAKFEQGTLYKPFDFAQRGLEENLAAMPQSQKVRNIANRDFDVGIGASMGMVDDMEIPASRQKTEEARQKFLKSQMGPYYKYGLENLEEKKPKKLNLQNNGIFSIRANNPYNT